MDQIKRHASSFLHDKYKTARIFLTDVTRAELLAEEATNNEPCSPNARTMAKIAEASFDIDDYWRIVDVLHTRLYNIDWKKWRQSYNSLVLLEFLLTHGYEDFAEEFICDIDVIEELGTFEHKDGKGFDWGLNMQKKSKKILELLQGGDTLKQARLKALKITNEIQGFGNSTASPSSSSSSSVTSQASSFGSYSTVSSVWSEMDETPHGKEAVKHYLQEEIGKEKMNTCSNIKGTHLWECSIDEKGSLLDSEEEEENQENDEPVSFLNGIYSKLGISPSRCDKKVAFRSVSDVGKVGEKRMDRQFSMGY